MERAILLVTAQLAAFVAPAWGQSGKSDIKGVAIGMTRTDIRALGCTEARNATEGVAYICKRDGLTVEVTFTKHLVPHKVVSVSTKFEFHRSPTEAVEETASQFGASPQTQGSSEWSWALPDGLKLVLAQQRTRSVYYLELTSTALQAADADAIDKQRRAEDEKKRATSVPKF